jgi:hypothetical protein
MSDLHGPLGYVLLLWGIVTSVLVVLVVYRGMLSNREDGQLFLNEAEDQMMGSETRLVVDRANRVQRSIIPVAILSGILLLISGGLWFWNALQGF